MFDKNFHLIKNLKPFMINLSIQCLIIKYIDDPPDHINNFIKYHYQIADISGSVILCIPHAFIQEELNKHNIDILNDDIEDLIESYNNIDLTINENQMNIKENKYIYDLNKKSNDKTLKCFFKVGDILNIYGAITTWSMGKMVIMPNTRIKKSNSPEIRGSIYRIGFFNMNINVEPNVSNLITSTTEKKYQVEDNDVNNLNLNSSMCKNADKKNNYIGDILTNNKVSKYDITPLFNDEQIL